jgi:hypothetical protein
VHGSFQLKGLLNGSRSGSQQLPLQRISIARLRNIASRPKFSQDVFIFFKESARKEAKNRYFQSATHCKAKILKQKEAKKYNCFY